MRINKYYHESTEIYFTKMNEGVVNMIGENVCRVYSYIDMNDYNWLKDNSTELSENVKRKISISQLVKLGILELKKNNTDCLREKLIENKIIGVDAL